MRCGWLPRSGRTIGRSGRAICEVAGKLGIGAPGDGADLGPSGRGRLGRVRLGDAHHAPELNIDTPHGNGRLWGASFRLSAARMTRNATHHRRQELAFWRGTESLIR